MGTLAFRGRSLAAGQTVRQAVRRAADQATEVVAELGCVQRAIVQMVAELTVQRVDRVAGLVEQMLVMRVLADVQRERGVQ